MNDKTMKKDVDEALAGDFLPKNYERPEKPSKYMKLKEGKTPFRVMSSAIVGWVYWTNDDKGKRKPVRVRTEDEVPKEFHGTGRNRVKHFWAFVVYNIADEMIQILEVTQNSIMIGIETYTKDKENWGSPKNYDLVINRVKTGSRDMDVDYFVSGIPPKPVDEGIKVFYEAMKIDLEALYKGEDPFEDKEAKDETSVR